MVETRSLDPITSETSSAQTAVTSCCRENSVVESDDPRLNHAKTHLEFKAAFFRHPEVLEKR